MGFTNFEFATTYKKKPKDLKLELSEVFHINGYVDGEILMKHKRMVFQGKNMKDGAKKKYFFHTICTQMRILAAFFSKSTSARRIPMKIEWI